MCSICSNTQGIDRNKSQIKGQIKLCYTDDTIGMDKEVQELKSFVNELGSYLEGTFSTLSEPWRYAGRLFPQNLENWHIIIVIEPPFIHDNSVAVRPMLQKIPRREKFSKQILALNSSKNSGQRLLQLEAKISSWEKNVKNSLKKYRAD